MNLTKKYFQSDLPSINLATEIIDCPGSITVDKNSVKNLLKIVRNKIAIGESLFEIYIYHTTDNYSFIKEYKNQMVNIIRKIRDNKEIKIYPLMEINRNIVPIGILINTKDKKEYKPLDKIPTNLLSLAIVQIYLYNHYFNEQINLRSELLKKWTIE